MKINLLPPEIKERQRARRQTTLVLLAGAAVLVLLVLFYLAQVGRLAGARRDLQAQEDRNSQLEQRIAELQRFDQLREELEATRTLEDQLLANAVLWSAVLRDISLVIPGDTWLTAMTAGLFEEAAGAAGAEGLVGEISFNGFALSHRAVALWLSRLEDVRGFANPWLSNSQKTLIGTREVVQFTSSVDVSELAVVAGGTTP